MRKRMCLLAGIVYCAMLGQSMAQAVGPVYPITEQDMLEAIKQKLEAKKKSGELQRLQDEAIARSKEAIMNPAPVGGLTKTVMPRSYYYDPTLVVNQEIKTPDGIVLAKPGDRLNPLDKVSMTNIMVFFDGRDSSQVAKAKSIVDRSNGLAMPILVGGSIDLMRIWKQRIYFDQSGVLVKKFGIRQVPALVYQEGPMLRIDEIAVEGGRSK